MIGATPTAWAVLPSQPDDTAPSHMERQLMRDFDFSPPEARAAKHMIQSGEITFAGTTTKEATSCN